MLLEAGGKSGVPRQGTAVPSFWFAICPILLAVVADFGRAVRLLRAFLTEL
jgi:hypothetical protein